MSVTGTDSLSQVMASIRARLSYLWVNTFEEERFSYAMNEICQELNSELYTWTSYSGIAEYNPEQRNLEPPSGDKQKTTQLKVALDYILNHKSPASKKGGSVWILKDAHPLLGGPIARQLRDMSRFLGPKQKKTIIFLSPGLVHGPNNRSGVELTLEKEISVVNFELPTLEQIEKYLRDGVNRIKEVHKKLKTTLQFDDDDYRKFAMALQGLTRGEVSNAMSKSLAQMKTLDEKVLLKEKKQIISRGEILEYIEQRPNLDEVGGLDAAKSYFQTYSLQFSKEAADFGVEPLRGVLLTGVPGTGKSLLAKAIANTWNLPLLRLDVGKVMTGLVGGSEEKMRQVINQVEAVSPCILWIDEIEKSLSGTKSSNFSDGGTLARVFGTLLTAMEERMKGVVTVATANDIQALPAELIRRFNEVFFVDLPTEKEREEIFEIHFKLRNRDIKKLKIDIQEAVKAADLFTGSEIEKAVKEAIARAFLEKQKNKKIKDVQQHHLISAIKETKPIAKVMDETVNAIREWAKHKARYASSQAEIEQQDKPLKTSTGEELVLDDDLKNVDIPFEDIIEG